MTLATPLAGKVGPALDSTHQKSAMKGVSIAEEEIASIKKSRRGGDGASQKSFARSIRSRKLGHGTQVLIESMQDRLSEQEVRIDKLQAIVDDWKVNNQPGWSLMAKNYPEFADMFETLKKEGGFVGLKSYEENPFGNA